MNHHLQRLLAVLTFSLPVTHSAFAAQPHNVILFVADGLRAMMVKPETAPTMAALSHSGVWFKNSHSLFPTFTMPNSSALATGHYLGDTGVFGNTINTGIPVPHAGNTITPFLESDEVLSDVDEHFGGNFLNEEALLTIARQAGFATAAVGKLGPTGIQAGVPRSDEDSVLIDDLTGRQGGIPLNDVLTAELQAAGLPLQAPTRGDNGKSGDAKTSGTLVANADQQRYFVNVVTKVLLPRFKDSGKPFVLVFWSRDPDGSQHNQGDSLGRLVPGINGPTSLAAIRNADDNLAAIKKTLESLGLDKTTDIVVTADHGFSTISKHSRSSYAAKNHYPDVPDGQLPPGFLAIDLAHGLGMPLYDPDDVSVPVDYRSGRHPKKSNGLIGASPAAAELVVAANGGSDLIYLPRANARPLAPRVVRLLLAQDYVSGLFVDDSLGTIPGTLPISVINLKGSALTPVPAIVVNFKSHSTGCKEATTCSAEVADTGLQEGQGMHGSFSRADTYNFMAAVGPDFKQGFADPAPASNADIGKTLAEILKLKIPARGTLAGRVLTEAMVGGRTPRVRHETLRSAPSRNGLRTVVTYQAVGKTKYFDAGGFVGRSVGLETRRIRKVSGSSAPLRP